MNRFHLLKKRHALSLLPFCMAFISPAMADPAITDAATVEMKLRLDDSPFNRSASAVTGKSPKQWIVEVQPGADFTMIASQLGASKAKAFDLNKTVYLIEFESGAPDFEILRSQARQFPEILSLEPQIPIRMYPRAEQTNDSSVDELSHMFDDTPYQEFYATLLATAYDPLFVKQWHLLNTGQFGGIPKVDINVVPIWKQKIGTNWIDGRGVNIGVVDDGMDFRHPDLATRFSATTSADFITTAPLDSPSLTRGAWPCIGNNKKHKFCHGTAVAGVISESSLNNIGGLGVAPGAKLSDLRLIYDANTDLMEGLAEKFMANIIAVKNNSWGPADKLGHYVPENGVYIYDKAHFIDDEPRDTRSLPVTSGAALQSALLDSAKTGRSGRGTIFVWSAGNGGEKDDTPHLPGETTGYQFVGDWGGFDGYACNRFVIAVGAINNKGKRSTYSERGPCILVTTPVGGESISDPGVITTDLRGLGNGYNFASSANGGDYTNANDISAFNGTSAAAPMIAGVAALMLQVKPTLSYRDVMHLLVKSARKTDPTNPSWSLNGVGLSVSPDYGFGLVDATKAVTLARTWTNVGPLVSYSKISMPSGVGFPIPNGNSGATFGFGVTQRIKVEHVEVVVVATHPTPGELEVRVQSPTSPKPVILAVPQKYRLEKDLAFKFTTPYFWNESSVGRWKVTVADKFPGNRGTLDLVKINIHGTAF